MRKHIAIATFACANLLSAENIGLVVLAGQSNMQGWQGNAASYPADPKGVDQKVKFYWVPPGYSSSDGKWTFLQPQGGRFAKGHFGPEVTFARLLVSDGCDVAVFKYSLGSTSLAGNWKAPGQHGMYDQMVAELRKAVTLLQEQGHTISFKAFVWIQGESDAQTKELAAGYGDRLKLLIDDFRKNVAKDMTLPIILGVDEQHPLVKNFPEVVEAQQKLAKDGQNIIFTSMIGLEKADETHLTPKGLEEHGCRLFAAYKTLASKGQQSTEGEQSDTNKSPEWYC
jgi:hypothetical protein